MRKRILPSTLTLAVVLLMSGCQERAPETADEKPNIILIMADDLGYETLGCYGGTSYRTPNLDQLAVTGIRFQHAYAQPLCTPTRLQLMTGKYNIRNWKAFGVMDPGERTFGHMMSEAGYKTCISGKWQLFSYNPPDFEPEWRGKGMRPEDAGFDEFFLWHAGHTEVKGSRYPDPVILSNGSPVTGTDGKYGPDLYTDYILDFIERNQSEPFFVYYPMALTHGPFNPTPLSPEWKAGDRLESNPRFFKDMVEYMDVLIGRIAGKLDETGLREKTLVIFFGDNGTPKQVESRLGDVVIQGGKGLPTDAGTRVPLIVNWRGTAPAGTVLEDLVDSSDFYPVLAELAGADLSREGPLDGRSFLPQIRGEKGTPRDWVFVHHDPRPGHSKKGFVLERWVRDHRYKLYEDGRLFDIPNDVQEKKPIAEGTGSPEAEQARKELRRVLDELPNPGPNVPDGTPGY